eukprot:4878989-Amphidinium_carterae.1
MHTQPVSFNSQSTTPSYVVEARSHASNQPILASSMAPNVSSSTTASNLGHQQTRPNSLPVRQTARMLCLTRANMSQNQL